MQPQVIRSRDNSLLQKARAVREGKIEELIFVEGLRLCEEALASNLEIDAVIYSEEIAQKKRAAVFLENVAPVTARVAAVSEKLLASISYTKTPQGIILLASRPAAGPELLKSKKTAALLVVMHGINNPVNVGAIMRTAEAAGATGAIATQHTSDPFSPKALRGAMGSAFRLPVWSEPTYQEVLEWCRANGVQTLCADARGSINYTKVDWRLSTALIL